MIQSIARGIFPASFMILSNSDLYFKTADKEGDLFNVVKSFTISNVADIHLMSSSVIAFNFHKAGKLKSIDKLVSRAGIVPDEVRENEDQLIELQEKRILFINAICALIYGRICAQRGTTLHGAMCSNPQEVYSYTVDNNGFLKTSDGWFQDLENAVKQKWKKFQTNKQPYHIIKEIELDDAISFTKKMYERSRTLMILDIEVALTLNYQAAILHNQSQPSASLALNLSVLEKLIEEVFYTYGLVNGYEKKEFISKECQLPTISRKKLKDMTFQNQIDYLKNNKVINDHLHERIENGRKRRNELMHRGGFVSSKESGPLLTAVRDVWGMLLDTPFELNAGWSYRI